MKKPRPRSPTWNRFLSFKAITWHSAAYNEVTRETSAMEYGLHSLTGTPATMLAVKEKVP